MIKARYRVQAQHRRLDETHGHARGHARYNAHLEGKAKAEAQLRYSSRSEIIKSFAYTHIKTCYDLYSLEHIFVQIKKAFKIDNSFLSKGKCRTCTINFISYDKKLSYFFRDVYNLFLDVEICYLFNKMYLIFRNITEV